jgi:oligopeptide transport system substrate-binding protein
VTRRTHTIRRARRSAAIGLVAAAAMALTACGSGAKTTSSSTAAAGASGSGGFTNGIVTLRGGEPQNPLIPTNTNEVFGARIETNLFAGLVYYDADGETQMDAAESITPNADYTVFTVKLRSGMTFDNGDPVDADSFINAWNFGAYEGNAQLCADFFQPIQGYKEENAPFEADSNYKPKDGDVVTLSGLKKVDDLDFTITMAQATPDWPVHLGYNAYDPLPKSAFVKNTTTPITDAAGNPLMTVDPAYGENPVGNGPYKLKGQGAWQHNVKIDLVPSKTYDGPRKPHNGGLTYEFITELETVYSDLLAGNLDVTDEIPESAFTTFESDLGSRAVNLAGTNFQSFTIPSRLPHFSGQEGQLRRQALSYAIDRATICKTIFNGTRTPAKDFSSPLMAGYSANIPGNEVLSYNPTKAKQLWAQADAISKWSGTFEIAYNGDSSHGQWVEAVLNSINQVLGIKTAPKVYPTFQAMRTDVTDRKIQTAFRTGWQADYPSIYDYLAPLYGTGGGSNDGDYSNTDFDNLLTEGLKQKTADESAVYYNQAQEILMKELPAIPLWVQNIVGGSSTKVSNVKWGWDTVPIAYLIEKPE